MVTGEKKRHFFWYGLAFCVGVGLCFAANWCYQVCRKPSEIIGLFDSRYYKKPKETWKTYGGDFKTYSTPIMSAEFLAALAQTETHGNTIARTYWQFNFGAKSPLGYYAPASTAVGLMQITDGTFKEARHYCVRDGEVLSDTSKPGCYFTEFYNRLIPSHSIEMTSAYLHSSVVEILKNKHLKKVGLKQKRDLAAVIHLCGKKRGETFASRKFRFHTGEKCGAMGVRAYVERVENLENSFYLISGAPRPKEARAVAAGKLKRKHVKVAGTKKKRRLT